jgi:lipopolysaccharide export system permease protein
MTVVQRYITRRTLTIFAATLFWVLAIVWTTQVLTRINVITTTGQSAATFLEIAIMVLPSVIPVIMPFAVGIAVANTLTTMNTDSELVVLSAAGSPRRTVLVPMLTIAACASIAAFAIHNFVEPPARERLRTIMAEARADLISSVIQEGTFQQIDRGLHIQIGDRLPDGRFAGIFVSDRREPSVELLYYAKYGAAVELFGQNLLAMEDGAVHRRGNDGEVSVVRYRSYAIDLSEFAPAVNGITLYPKDRTLNYLLNPDPNDPTYQEWPQRMRGELHRRLSEWLYPFVFALIALAVAGDARSFRDARIHPLLTTMAVALVVRWAGFMASDANESSASAVYAVYGVPVGAAAMAAWFIRTNRVLEVPTAFNDAVLARTQAIGDRLRSLGPLAIGRGGGGAG